MKTPDEIKKGMECCQTTMRCEDCPYSAVSTLYFDCTNALNGDAIAYIQQLEANHSKVKAELKRLTQNHIEDMKIIGKLERERDAAVRDIIANCAICKYHDHERICCKLKITLAGEYADDCVKFEWRGICPENTED